MTIANREWEAIGARTYVPEGPFGLVGTTSALNGPTFNYGDVVDGNCESEFIYLKFSPVASVTYNQGDVFVWDSTLMAVPAKLGAGYHQFGAHVGTIFFGGRTLAIRSVVCCAKGQGKYLVLYVLARNLWDLGPACGRHGGKLYDRHGANGPSLYNCGVWCGSGERTCSWAPQILSNHPEFLYGPPVANFHGDVMRSARRSALRR